MKAFNTLLFFVCLYSLPLCAAQAAPASLITMRNSTPNNLYAAVYELDGEQYKRRSINLDEFDARPLVALLGNGEITVRKPRARAATLWLYVAYAEGILAQTIEAKIVEALKQEPTFASIQLEPAVAVYTIALVNQKLTINPPAQRSAPSLFERTSAFLGNLYQGAQAALARGGQAAKPALLPLFENHPHRNQTAHVSFSPTLPAQEEAYLKSRHADITNAVKKIINTDVAVTPRIALCCSGGGMRAMLGTLGTLQALSQWQPSAGPGGSSVNFLDACTYCAGLSGSTWAMAGWIHSGKTVEQYLRVLTPKLAKPLDDQSTIDFYDLGLALIKPFLFDNPVSCIDIYGALLAQKILPTGSPNSLTLPEQAELARKNNVPFPLYTAVTSLNEMEQKRTGYTWCEISPYTTRLINMAPPLNRVAARLEQSVTASLETWAFCRHFNHGISTNTTPSPSTGFIMGICGSAFSATIVEAYTKIKGKLPEILAGALSEKSGIATPLITPFTHGLFAAYNASIENTIRQYPVATTRVFPAQVPNWLKGNITDQATLTLLDAGLDFNFPVPPLLRQERGTNIIIMLDLGPANWRDLQRAAEYAREHKMKFPQLPENYHEILAKESCSIFYNMQETNTPMVIYLQPLKANLGFDNGRDILKEAFTKTENFVYTEEQVQRIVGLVQANVSQCKEKITRAIRQWVETHKKTAASAAAGAAARG